MTILTRPTALTLLFEARNAVEEAIGIESRHPRHFGGHKHQGGRHPLLTLPLPNGYRRVKR